MTTVGLIVEYNPFHNGHLYHLQQSKKVTGADTVVTVMSGHFLQRGEPALVNKWARAEMALKTGADLVIELPVAYATQNAEIFAYGAVSTLDKLGIIDYLCFGSESGDMEWMQILAKLLADEPALFTDNLQENLNKGLPYPKAYANAAKSLMKQYGCADVPVDQPNNILGLNYLLSLERRKSTIKPYTIERKKADYNQRDITDERIASATALRGLMLKKRELEAIQPFVPETTYDILQRELEENRGPITWDNYYKLLLEKLILLSPEDLQFIHEMVEGLEYRFKQYSLISGSFEELIHQVKSKRYTWNRLQRLSLYTLFQLTKQKYNRMKVKDGPYYIRVLGFNRKGQHLLKKIRKTCSLPVITNIPRDRHPMLDLDIHAGALYALGYPNDVNLQALRREYQQAPIQV